MLSRLERKNMCAQIKLYVGMFTAIFGQLFVIATLELNSMQKILTFHVLEFRPTQMHTKSTRMVYPFEDKKKNN